MSAIGGVTRKDVFEDCGEEITQLEYAFAVEFVKDFNQGRAAKDIGKSPSLATKYMQRVTVISCIDLIVQARQENGILNAEWLLHEMLDNHRLARSAGNLTASNTALNLLAKHVSIDAYAALKIDVQDNTVVERLQRGRANVAKAKGLTFR